MKIQELYYHVKIQMILSPSLSQNLNTREIKIVNQISLCEKREKSTIYLAYRLRN